MCGLAPLTRLGTMPKKQHREPREKCTICMNGTVALGAALRWWRQSSPLACNYPRVWGAGQSAHRTPYPTVFSPKLTLTGVCEIPKQRKKKNKKKKTKLQTPTLPHKKKKQKENLKKGNGKKEHELRGNKHNWKERVMASADCVSDIVSDFFSSLSN